MPTSKRKVEQLKKIPSITQFEIFSHEDPITRKLMFSIFALSDGGKLYEFAGGKWMKIPDLPVS